jgi:uncharacterized caspase-like protein
MNFLRGLLLLLVCVSGYAQQGGARVALVIGNSSYKASPLRNPTNDSQDIAAKLRGLGFTVVERSNLTVKQIGGTLREFRSKLTPGSVALVFYAGHGLQIKGENYLPAVDADISSEEDVPTQSLATKQIMDVLGDAKTRLNLVFLDACRDNPYARGFRSASRGLSKESAPSGTLISFATRPGGVASDGDGKNGLYTSVLLQAMNSTNLPIEQLLKKVVSGVKVASNGKQEPWMEGSIEGDFCFGQCSAAQATFSDDRALWESVKDSKDVADLRAYLERFPDGLFAKVASNRIRSLQASNNDQENAAKKAQEERLTVEARKAEEQRIKAEIAKNAKLAIEAQQIKQREVQEAQRAEQAEWDEAKSTNTSDSYSAYLERYPSGRFGVQAKAAQQRLKAEVEKEAEKERIAAEARQAQELRIKAEIAKNAEAERLADEAKKVADERDRAEAAKRAEEQRAQNMVVLKQLETDVVLLLTKVKEKKEAAIKTVGQEAAIKTVERWISEVPSWYSSYPRDIGWHYVGGTQESSNRQIAVDGAIDSARMSLKAQFSQISAGTLLTATEISLDRQIAVATAVDKAQRFLADYQQLGGSIQTTLILSTTEFSSMIVRGNGRVETFDSEGPTAGGDFENHLRFEISRIPESIVSDVNRAKYVLINEKIVVEDGKYRAFVLLRYPKVEINKMWANVVAAREQREQEEADRKERERKAKIMREEERKGQEDRIRKMLSRELEMERKKLESKDQTEELQRRNFQMEIANKYAASVQAAIRPNITFNPQNISGNPAVEIYISLAADGAINARTITQSSGVPDWDRAAIAALDKTKRLPKNADGSVPGALTLILRPKER